MKNISDAFAGYKTGNKAAAAELIDNARGYISLMLAHIDKENNVLYPMADNRFQGKSRKNCTKDLKKSRSKESVRARHEEFHALIEKLMGIYSV